MKVRQFLLSAIVMLGFIYFLMEMQDNDDLEEITTTLQTTREEVTEPNDEIILNKDTSLAYKIAIANANHAYEIISSENEYSEALHKVQNIDNNHLIIVHQSKIIYVKYGFVDLKTKSASEITLFYVNGIRNYINGHSAMDALFINKENNEYRMQISNAVGLVNESDVKLAPMAYVRSPSHYLVNSNNELVHAISTNIYEEDAFVYSGMLDQAPDYLEQGKRYFSYDGIYFYTDIISLTIDKRNNSHERAINHDKPYYNYYQYLPLRGKTRYTADELNQFLIYKLNKHNFTNSVLYNTGELFINAQNEYHVNGVIELAWAIHESGYGTSRIAIDKNNLFGLNARDENPYGDAYTFTSIENSIEEHMNQYVNLSYLNTDYHNYSGGILGNKGIGVNIFYASDPYWGEKIAATYYQIDKYLGFKDKGYYQIGFINSQTRIYKDRNSSQLEYIEHSSNVDYRHRYSVIILNIEVEEVEILTNNNTVGYVEKKDINILQ